PPALGQGLGRRPGLDQRPDAPVPPEPGPGPDLDRGRPLRPPHRPGRAGPQVRAEDRHGGRGLLPAAVPARGRAGGDARQARAIRGTGPEAKTARILDGRGQGRPPRPRLVSPGVDAPGIPTGLIAKRIALPTRPTGRGPWAWRGPNERGVLMTPTR